MRCERQVYVVITKKKGVDSVYVRNDLYAPVEIELSFGGLKNVSGAPSRPIRRYRSYIGHGNIRERRIDGVRFVAACLDGQC